METVEITITVHTRKQRMKDAARRRLARMDWWAVAWYVFLLAAGIALYRAGAVWALEQRGYYAVGGEALMILLPVVFFVTWTTVRDTIRDLKARR